MANSELVSKVAHLRKVSTQYVNYLGECADVPQENIEMILRTMAYDLDSDEHLYQEAMSLDTYQWHLLLEPVTVLSPLRDSWGASLYLTSAELGATAQWEINTEFGGKLAGSARLMDLPQTGDYWIGDTQHVRRVLPLPEDLPHGYHQLTVSIADKSMTAKLIVAPRTIFHNEPMKRSDKVWGTAVQLYTLRTENNWGMGDFADLKDLIQLMSDQGADVIGLNPIHALYPISPDHCSPYSPSNRSFLNVLYISVPDVPEFAESKALQRKLATKKFLAEQARLQATEDVEYQGVSKLKHECFQMLFSVFKQQHLGKGTQRDQDFQHFVKQQGEPLYRHALFEALLTHFKAQDINAWGWPVWPEAYQDQNSAEVKAFAEQNEEAIIYWQYLQFLADEQVQAADQLAKMLGMKVGLYRDLAVGADRGGAEVWSNKSTFCLDASVGAPPDALGPAGQNWGLPPFDPTKLKEEGYSSFITLLRNNMRACGALRIDHALALLRLWWCPPGRSAAYGAYVYYDLFDLLGILCLESQRNQCMVIAEDLGTVPEEVTEFFPKAELYSNKVFYFEIGPEGCTKPQDYATKALAIICNHDMPTLKAFWNKSDLDLRKELKMFACEEDYRAEQATREANKKHIIDLLRESGRLPDGADETQPEMTEPLMLAIHDQLAVSNSQIITVQLEDLMLINSPVNIPGTSSEYPNWRRKLLETSKDLFAKPQIQQFCQRMNRNRQLAEA